MQTVIPFYIFAAEFYYQVRQLGIVIENLHIISDDQKDIKCITWQNETLLSKIYTLLCALLFFTQLRTNLNGNELFKSE